MAHLLSDPPTGAPTIRFLTDADVFHKRDEQRAHAAKAWSSLKKVPEEAARVHAAVENARTTPAASQLFFDVRPHGGGITPATVPKESKEIFAAYNPFAATTGGTTTVPVPWSTHLSPSGVYVRDPTIAGAHAVFNGPGNFSAHHSAIRPPEGYTFPPDYFRPSDGAAVAGSASFGHPPGHAQAHQLATYENPDPRQYPPAVAALPPSESTAILGAAATAGLTMPNSEDVLKAQILTLFGRCDHDVSLLLERVVRALQDAGRTDLRFELDGHGSVMTVAQSTRFAPDRHRAPFATALEAKLDASRVGVHNPKDPLSKANRQLSKHGEGGLSSDPSEHHSAGSARDAIRQRRIHDEVHRCFPRTDIDEKLEAFPASPYNGNFLLRRWGGAFPDHCRYEHYRKFGEFGQGAKTAEYHNFPCGLPPQEHGK